MQVPPSEHPAEDSPDSYANGVLTYAQEIASRTEQYWRPVKHATDPAAPHAR